MDHGSTETAILHNIGKKMRCNLDVEYSSIDIAIFNIDNMLVHVSNAPDTLHLLDGDTHGHI